MNKSSFWRKGLGIAVSVLCLLYLWTAYDWTNIGPELRAIPWVKFLGLIILLVLVMYCLRGARWYLLVRAHASGLSLLSAYLHNALGQALSEVTPAQSGEAVKVILAKQNSPSPLAPIIGAFSLERFYDLLIFAFILISVYIMDGAPEFIVFSAPKFSTLVFVLVIFMVGLLWFFKKAEFITQALHGFRPHSFKAIWGPFFLTLLSWGVIFYMWQYTLSFAHIDIKMSTLVWVLGLSMFAGILSFAPSGLGASDATVAVLLTSSGVSVDAALTATLLLRLLSIVMIGLGLCHLPFTQRPKRAS